MDLSNLKTLSVVSKELGVPPGTLSYREKVHDRFPKPRAWFTGENLYTVEQIRDYLEYHPIRKMKRRGLGSRIKDLTKDIQGES